MSGLPGHASHLGCFCTHGVSRAARPPCLNPPVRPVVFHKGDETALNGIVCIMKKKFSRCDMTSLDQSSGSGWRKLFCRSSILACVNPGNKAVNFRS